LLGQHRLIKLLRRCPAGQYDSIAHGLVLPHPTNRMEAKIIAALVPRQLRSGR
jgi:hypothetical protein